MPAEHRLFLRAPAFAGCQGLHTLPRLFRGLNSSRQVCNCQTFLPPPPPDLPSQTVFVFLSVSWLIYSLIIYPSCVCVMVPYVSVCHPAPLLHLIPKKIHMEPSSGKLPDCLCLPVDLHICPLGKGVLGGVGTHRGSGLRGLEVALCLVPGAPALSLELGREKPSQGAVHQENDNGDPRLRLRLQRGRWGDHT